MPAGLLWLKIETTDLPNGTDASGALPLSIGALLTDKALKPVANGGAYGFVSLTKAHKESLVRNRAVFDHHMKTGAIEAANESEYSLRSIEGDIVEMIDENGGEAILAGDALPNFLWPVVQHHMPTLAKRLTFYSLDLSNARRAIAMLDPNYGKWPEGSSNRADDAVVAVSEFPAPISFPMATLMNNAGHYIDRLVR